MAEIHPTAYVDRRAELGPDVEVGPFAHVGADVQVGAGCVIHSRVTLLGPLDIGEHCTFFPGAVLGSAPQDLKYKGGPTRLSIGNHNVFRELVTVHRGTEVDRRSGGVTRIGDHNLLMVGVHVAHDAQVENHVILANNVLIAGHVHIEDCVNVGGASAMHHFVTVGRNAFVGGMTRVTSDVPPFMKIAGYDAVVHGVNAEGMRRWKFPEESVTAVKEAYRLLYGRRGEQGVGRTGRALDEIETNGLMEDPQVRYLVEFIRRQMREGVFGRARERGRSDSDQDRETFYSQKRARSTEPRE